MSETPTICRDCDGTGQVEYEGKVDPCPICDERELQAGGKVLPCLYKCEAGIITLPGSFGPVSFPCPVHGKDAPDLLEWKTRLYFALKAKNALRTDPEATEEDRAGAFKETFRLSSIIAFLEEPPHA